MKSPQFGLLLAKGEDQDHSRLPEVMNSGTCSGNTRILQVFPQNTADYRFKMYANGRFWEANLMGDRPELLVKEKKGCFRGRLGMPGFRDLVWE
jgi:hypothetical protein